jgi:hypothetical protein
MENLKTSHLGAPGKFKVSRDLIEIVAIVLCVAAVFAICVLSPPR